MKIRTDFVTNSSSSSFIAYFVDCKELVDYIKKQIDEDNVNSPWNVEGLRIDHDNLVVYTNQFGGEPEAKNNLADLKRVLGIFCYDDETYQELSDIIDRNSLAIYCEKYYAYTDDICNPLSGGNFATFSHRMILRDKTFTIQQGNLDFVSPNLTGKCVIPDEVHTIHQNAFELCTNITELVISKNVKRIKDYTFSRCKELTRVVIPENIEYIGKRAFSRCHKLTDITIYARYAELHGFHQHGVAQTIHGYSNSTAQTYAQKYGIHFDAIDLSPEEKENTLLNDQIHDVLYADGWAVSCKKDVTSIEIEPGAIGIKRNAFVDHKKLTKVIIPDSVTEIERSAFRGCVNLESIYVPDSVTSIGEYAWKGCHSLANITLPKGITIIAKNTFKECKKLECIVIPEGVTKIENYAFANCTALKSVTIPKTVTKITDYAFAYCTSIESVHITDVGAWSETYFENDNANPLSYGADLYCNGTLITDLVIPDGVTYIQKYAFYNCTSLTSIKIPDSVTIISSEAFENTGLLSKQKGPVYSIDGWIVDCDADVTSINIPDGTRGIAAEAFSKAKISKVHIKSLTAWMSIWFGDNPLSCGADLYCDGVKLTDIVIPNGLMEIHNGTFRGCTSIKRVSIPDGVTSIGSVAFCDCTSLTNINIPDSVTSIGYAAFCDCTNLTNIKIPDSVTYIERCAFYNCTSLMSIKIPDGVTNIGNSAFYNCTSLTNIKIPDGVTDIGNSAFYNCTSLTNVNIPNSVTYIERCAFYDCTSLTSIKIPDSVTIISSEAFYNTGLLSNQKGPVYSVDGWIVDCDADATSINIPDGTRGIADGTFSKAKISEVHIKSLTAWMSIWFGDNPLSCGADLYCDGVKLTDIVIPNGLMKIHDSTFRGCTSIKRVSIPDGVTSIGYSAFRDCTNLTNINIPDSVTDIGSSAFYNTGLLSKQKGPVYSIDGWIVDCYADATSINIPDGTRGIAGYVFNYDCALRTLEIPESVKFISEHTFKESKYFESITILSKTIEISDHADINPNISIYGYPNSTAEAYAKKNGNPFIPIEA